MFMPFQLNLFQCNQNCSFNLDKRILNHIGHSSHQYFIGLYNITNQNDRNIVLHVRSLSFHIPTHTSVYLINNISCNKHIILLNYVHVKCNTVSLYLKVVLSHDENIIYNTSNSWYLTFVYITESIIRFAKRNFRMSFM